MAPLLREVRECFGTKVSRNNCRIDDDLYGHDRVGVPGFFRARLQLGPL